MASSISAKEKVDALLELIQSATRDAVAEYERQGHEIPSLDTPIAHPLDQQTTSLALKNAIRILEGACEHLCSTLAPPTHTMVNVSLLVHNIDQHTY